MKCQGSITQSTNDKSWRLVQEDLRLESGRGRIRRYCLTLPSSLVLIRGIMRTFFPTLPIKILLIPGQLQILSPHQSIRWCLLDFLNPCPLFIVDVYTLHDIWRCMADIFAVGTVRNKKRPEGLNMMSNVVQVGNNPKPRPCWGFSL